MASPGDLDSDVFLGLTVHPLSASIGAEVSGVDLATADQLAPATVARLRALLHEHGVLVFRRDSCLRPEQSQAFYRHFLAVPNTDAVLAGDAAVNNDPNLLTAFPSAPAVQLIGNGVPQ